MIIRYRLIARYMLWALWTVKKEQKVPEMSGHWPGNKGYPGDLQKRQEESECGVASCSATGHLCCQCGGRNLKSRGGQG